METFAASVAWRSRQKGSPGQGQSTVCERGVLDTATGGKFVDRCGGEEIRVYRVITEDFLLRDRGEWARLLEAVLDDPDFEWLMIDASYIKAHPHSAGARGGSQAIARTKGG